MMLLFLELQEVHFNLLLNSRLQVTESGKNRFDWFWVAETGDGQGQGEPVKGEGKKCEMTNNLNNKNHH